MFAVLSTALLVTVKNVPGHRKSEVVSPTVLNDVVEPVDWLWVSLHPSISHIIQESPSLPFLQLPLTHRNGRHIHDL